MGKALTTRALADRLADLETTDRRGLCELWSETFQKPAPKGWSQAMLRRALATELQGKVLGTLTNTELKELSRFAPKAASVSPEGEDGRGHGAHRGRRTVPAPTPGTRLIRTWHGKTYGVTVLEGG